MKLHPAAVGLLLFLAASTAQAQKPNDIGSGEMALLPDFCIDTVGFKYGSRYYNPSPRAPYWVSKMGLGFWTMHHYCWARINLRRVQLQEMDRNRRAMRVPGILGDLEFVIRNNSTDFVMLPEVYTRLAEAELIRNNPAAAFGHVESAIRKKADYVPVYYLWGEYLISAGQSAIAKEFLKKGIDATGGDASLRELYAKAGGDRNVVASGATLSPTAATASSAPPARAASQAR